LLGAICINPCQKVLVLKTKKVSYKIYSVSGLEPEPQFGFAARGAGVGAERNNFGFVTLVRSKKTVKKISLAS
jgi:hypothetical protein